MLCPLTHKKLHFVTQSSHIENSLKSVVLVDRQAFLVQLNKISSKMNSIYLLFTCIFHSQPNRKKKLKTRKHKIVEDKSSNLQHFEANELSLELSSLVRCEHCTIFTLYCSIFQLLSACFEPGLRIWFSVLWSG